MEKHQSNVNGVCDDIDGMLTLDGDSENWIGGGVPSEGRWWSSHLRDDAFGK